MRGGSLSSVTVKFGPSIENMPSGRSTTTKVGPVPACSGTLTSNQVPSSLAATALDFTDFGTPLSLVKKTALLKFLAPKFVPSTRTRKALPASSGSNAETVGSEVAPPVPPSPPEPATPPAPPVDESSGGPSEPHASAKKPRTRQEAKTSRRRLIDPPMDGMLGVRRESDERRPDYSRTGSFAPMVIGTAPSRSGVSQRVPSGAKPTTKRCSLPDSKMETEPEGIRAGGSKSFPEPSRTRRPARSKSSP